MSRIETLGTVNRPEIRAANAYVAEYAASADAALQGIWAKKRIIASGISPIVEEMVDIHADSNSGGKKFRGALVTLGYEASGGIDRERAVRASLASEVIHNAFLVHDDVMDNTPVRRGKPAVHRRYASLGQEKFPNKDSDHYGISMAIDVGDLGAAVAYEILMESGFSSDRTLAAIKRLNAVIINTTFGEALDMGFNPLSPDIKTRDILQLHFYKTAEYSFIGPLQIGATLAGGDEETLTNLQRFALPLGIAFQIKDDILGMFGDEKSLGKPVDSDIKEGKNTLLIIKARQEGTIEDRRFLDSVYGNQHITAEELERVRQIIKMSGSLNYSERMMEHLTSSAIRNATRISPDPQLQAIFVGIASSMLSREN